MARLTIEGFDDVDKLFAVLGNPREFTTAAVNEAAPILEKATRNAVRQAASKGYATGGLAESFVRTPAKSNKYGTYSVVRPVGGRKTYESDKEEHSYVERACWLEYGRNGGYERSDMLRPATSQEPSPFRQKAINDAKAECEEAMKRKVYEAVDKAGG